MKRYGRLDENLQGTLQKNRVFCAVMPIHDQRISRRTETRRLFELTKLKKAPSFVIVGLFSADHYLVPCLSLLSSECVVFTDVPRDFQRLAEYFSDGWRREGVIDSSCLFKIGAEVRTVRWKISNNTHPVPVLNNTFLPRSFIESLSNQAAAVTRQVHRKGLPDTPQLHHPA